MHKQSFDEADRGESLSGSDSNGLSNWVSFPRQPQSVKREQIPVAHGNDSRLVALLRFADEDYQYIIENSTHFEVQREELVEQAFFDCWIAPNLPIGNSVKEQGELLVLESTYAMEPNLFTQKANSPFIHGRIIPLGRGLIVLSLYTM